MPSDQGKNNDPNNSIQPQVFLSKADRLLEKLNQEATNPPTKYNKNVPGGIIPAVNLNKSVTPHTPPKGLRSSELISTKDPRSIQESRKVFSNPPSTSATFLKVMNPILPTVGRRNEVPNDNPSLRSNGASSNNGKVEKDLPNKYQVEISSRRGALRSWDDFKERKEGEEDKKSISPILAATAPLMAVFAPKLTKSPSEKELIANETRQSGQGKNTIESDKTSGSDILKAAIKKRLQLGLDPSNQNEDSDKYKSAQDLANQLKPKEGTAKELKSTEKITPDEQQQSKTSEQQLQELSSQPNQQAQQTKQVAYSNTLDEMNVLRGPQSKLPASKGKQGTKGGRNSTPSGGGYSGGDYGEGSIGGFPSSVGGFRSPARRPNMPTQSLGAPPSFPPYPSSDMGQSQVAGSLPGANSSQNPNQSNATPNNSKENKEPTEEQEVDSGSEENQASSSGGGTGTTKPPKLPSPSHVKRIIKFLVIFILLVIIIIIISKMLNSDKDRRTSYKEFIKDMEIKPVDNSLKINDPSIGNINEIKYLAQFTIIDPKDRSQEYKKFKMTALELRFIFNIPGDYKMKVDIENPVIDDDILSPDDTLWGNINYREDNRMLIVNGGDVCDSTCIPGKYAAFITLTFPDGVPKEAFDEYKGLLQSGFDGSVTAKNPLTDKPTIDNIYPPATNCVNIQLSTPSNISQQDCFRNSINPSNPNDGKVNPVSGNFMCPYDQDYERGKTLECTDYFGNPRGGLVHGGMDFAIINLDPGLGVRSPVNGTVIMTDVKNNTQCGQFVRIREEGVQNEYTFVHLDNTTLWQTGDRVTQGMILGHYFPGPPGGGQGKGVFSDGKTTYLCWTGVHSHLEYVENGISKSIIDLVEKACNGGKTLPGLCRGPVAPKD